MKSLEELTAELTRRQAKIDTTGKGLSKVLAGADGPSDMVRRLLTKKSLGARDGVPGRSAVPVDSSPDNSSLDNTAGLERQLARARMAVLSKETPLD